MSLIQKIRGIYLKYVYYRVKDTIRGSHKLKNWLDNMVGKNLEDFSGEPESVFERGDWDNLIILDACRHDEYEEVTGRRVGKRVSLGSTSQEYFARTYAEGDFSDFVYISANGYVSDPMLERLTGRSNIFHELFELYNTDWGESGWIPPEAVIRDAKTAEKLFKDKRKIMHFLQPHDPFVDKEMRNLIKKHDAHRNEHDLAVRGIIDKDKLVEGYKNNLEFVLQEIEEKLLPHLEGKTVITADHGELLGEKGMFRHPGGLDAKVLREVPWDVVDKDSKLIKD